MLNEFYRAYGEARQLRPRARAPARADRRRRPRSGRGASSAKAALDLRVAAAAARSPAARSRHAARPTCRRARPGPPRSGVAHPRQRRPAARRPPPGQRAVRRHARWSTAASAWCRPARPGSRRSTATLLTKGAGGRDATAFADAVASLGAAIDADASWHDVTRQGLRARLPPRPDPRPVRRRRAAPDAWPPADFARERDLALAAHPRPRRGAQRRRRRSVAHPAVRPRRPARRPDGGYAATVGR